MRTVFSLSIVEYEGFIKACSLTEVNEEASVTLALVLWKNHDA